MKQLTLVILSMLLIAYLESQNVLTFLSLRREISESISPVGLVVLWVFIAGGGLLVCLMFREPGLEVLEGQGVSVVGRKAEEGKLG